MFLCSPRGKNRDFPAKLEKSPEGTAQVSMFRPFYMPICIPCFKCVYIYIYLLISVAEITFIYFLLPLLKQLLTVSFSLRIYVCIYIYSTMHSRFLSIMLISPLWLFKPTSWLEAFPETGTGGFTQPTNEAGGVDGFAGFNLCYVMNEFFRGPTLLLLDFAPTKSQSACMLTFSQDRLLHKVDPKEFPTVAEHGTLNVWRNNKLALSATNWKTVCVFLGAAFCLNNFWQIFSSSSFWCFFVMTMSKFSHQATVSAVN